MITYSHRKNKGATAMTSNQLFVNRIVENFPMNDYERQAEKIKQQRKQKRKKFFLRVAETIIKFIVVIIFILFLVGTEHIINGMF